MKTILLLALLSTFGTFISSPGNPVVQEQDNSTATFTVSLKYNQDFERYEVYALPNFTQKLFPLGPSQISIVVPQQIADQPLAIYSATARWTDYSSVYAPSIAPNIDFHGVHSMGQLIDVQQDTPLMLFSFSLKGGYVDGVRLYVNGKDPDSIQKGMMGGDFSNTIQDYKSHELYKSGFDQAEVAEAATENPLAGEPTLSIYPNPISGDFFSVTAQKFQTGDRLKLRLLSATGVEFYGLEEDAANVVNYRLKVPKQLGGQAYLRAERMGTTNKQRIIYKKLIILNE